MRLLTQRSDVGEFRRRYRWMVVLVVGFFIALVGRLTQLQLVEGEVHRAQARRNIVREGYLATTRGVIRDAYGSGAQGRQLLITRRLLERGVRFVQVWSGAGQPWDNHENLEKDHRKLAAEWDQPIAAFLADLKQRGLFDETLVLWSGEFGRTPVAELPALSGRDHNHYGFSVWLAGGGVKGGTVYGATDEFGFRAVENPVHVHDLHATVLHLLGLDHERLTYRYAGRDFRLTDVAGNVVKGILA